MFKLKLSCGACPEAYDVFHNDECIGYLRLRHGSFTASYKGEIVYAAEPKGDGVFEENERKFYLNKACKAIKEAMDEDGELLYEIE